MENSAAVLGVADVGDLGEALKSRSASRMTNLGISLSCRREKSSWSPARNRESSSETVNSTFSGSKWSHSAMSREVGLSFIRRSHSSCEKRRMRSLKACFGSPIGIKKEEIDVGVREKTAAAETAEGHQGKILCRGARRDDFVPQPQQDLLHQLGALENRRQTVARSGELLLNACRFSEVEIAEFSA